MELPPDALDAIRDYLRRYRPCEWSVCNVIRGHLRQLLIEVTRLRAEVGRLSGDNAALRSDLADAHAGFHALPPGGETGNGQVTGREPSSGFATTREAAVFIAEASGSTDPARIAALLTNADAMLAAVCRAALKRTHPDRGGNPADFRRVQDAHAILSK